MPIKADGQIRSGPPGWDGSVACARDGAALSRWRRVLHADSGTATVEFCMVFPIVLFLTLMLAQATLLMVGNQFVHYAAFAATRSAIVYIPQDTTGWDSPGQGEPYNVIVPVNGRAKFDAIRAAAYLAVAPVCGKREDGGEDLRADEYVAGLRDHFAAYGQDAPRWIETLAAARLRYAAANTDVQVLETDVDDTSIEYYDIAPIGYTFGPREAITVRVEHRLNLSVPYVRAIFADGEHNNGRGKYALVSAQYTLTNEGVDPDLPDPPELPRDSR
jgi:TadE-like protein